MHKQTYTERLHSWIVYSISPSEIQLSFQGIMKETCLILFLPLSPSAPVLCEVDSCSFQESFRSIPNFKCSSIVRNFIKSRVSSLCKQLNGLTLCSKRKSFRFQTQQLINFVECSINRFEIVTKEISLILKKYGAVLEEGKYQENTFTITINFFGRNASTTNLRTLFLLLETYPFSPMDMFIIEEESHTTGKNRINTDSLIRLLRSKVKPGYAYLSRICEFTTAFLKK